MMVVALDALGDSCPRTGVPGERLPWPGTAGHGAGSRTPGVCALMHQDSLQIPGWRGAVRPRPSVRGAGAGRGPRCHPRSAPPAGDRAGHGWGQPPLPPSPAVSAAEPGAAPGGAGHSGREVGAICRDLWLPYLQALCPSPVCKTLVPATCKDL